ncbi:Tetratricopeptide repeat protein 36 [Chytridiales sp. JEL 0842]|nr:Tetratricopeptide repeat protein 36 [Chytridiales sp. JEL 0842]
MSLSKRDEDLLEVIFNKDQEFIIPEPTPESPYPKPDNETLQTLKTLELEAVKLVEKSNDLEGAIKKFTECVTLFPTYASAYNNRAQALRMKGDKVGALEDLDRAVKFGVGETATLKQAYAQRGFLRKAMGDAKGAEEDFAMGAKLGNELAKRAVRENPYAKMCNAMVSEAMAKLK